jgi:predicted RNA-binding protein with TRAM domain
MTIAAESCPVAAPTGSPTASPASSGLMMSLFAPRGMGSLVVAASLLASLTGAYGQSEACMPSVEIEISLPIGADVDTSYGETDHYLAATTDTVVWGYFDATAPFKATVASGETITVEVITHHSSHDYAKMIRGDPAVEEIFYWATGESLTEKNEPKLPGSGVHLITGPIQVTGAMPGDVVQVDILELEPRYNPSTGKCFGTNSQKFAGFHYNSLTGFKRDGTPYVRTGGTEAITVFEFLEEEGSKMKWAKPVYMYRFPNMTAPDGSIRTFDNNPAVTIPHEFNHGYNGELLEPDAIVYPPGFDGTAVSAPSLIFQVIERFVRVSAIRVL